MVFTFADQFLGHKSFAQLLNHLPRGEGVSAVAQKHIEIGVKVVIYSSMAPCKRLACHYLHTVDAYSRFFGESLDWQSSTGKKSMSQVSKIRG